MKKKWLLGLGSIVAVATPIVAVVSCGDAVTGEGENTDIDNEGAPAGFHWVKVPHGDHFHILLVKDGEQPPTFFAEDWVVDDGTGKIPNDAFVNHDMDSLLAEHPEIATYKFPERITEIGARSFSGTDLSGLTAMTLEHVNHFLADSFKNAILPNGWEIPAGATLERGAFEGATHADGTPVSTASATVNEGDYVPDEITTLSAQGMMMGFYRQHASDFVDGEGASAVVKSDLSGLSTGVAAEVSFAAEITTPAVDGTLSNPAGTDGTVHVVVSPNQGYQFTGGADTTLPHDFKIPAVPLFEASASTFIDGEGASATVKSDLSSIASGITFTADITTAAVDGTIDAPEGTPGEVTVTATDGTTTETFTYDIDPVELFSLSAGRYSYVSARHGGSVSITKDAAALADMAANTPGVSAFALEITTDVVFGVEGGAAGTNGVLTLTATDDQGADHTYEIVLVTKIGVPDTPAAA